MSKEIKKCEYCGEEFEAVRVNKQFCSKKCIMQNWNKNNKAYQKEYQRRWYEANKEKAKACSKKWREVNEEKYKAAGKRWYEANKEKSKIANKEWYQNNKELGREYKRKSNYRRYGYSEEWLEVKELQYQIKQELKKQQENN